MRTQTIRTRTFPGRFVICLVTLVILGTACWRAQAQTIAGTGDVTTAVKQVAKQTIPAVVHIDVTERQEVANPVGPMDQDPFFRFFFHGPAMPRKFKQEVKGLGTGMIIDTQGHILTNNHVAGGASKLEVVLANGQKYTAHLVGADPKTDLAVIQIDTKEPLQVVSFGNSDTVEVGEWVVAIGHPRGLDQTVTHGIISAKHRQGIMEPSSYQDFLQTDAAINPGNSGGPLLNLQGEVIGVNAAIASQTGGFEGIGFAIPSNMALHVARELITHGKVARAWLGVSVQDITSEQAKTWGLPAPKGARITTVAQGGPAAQAGLLKDDVIVTYREQEVTNASALRNAVATTSIGQAVTMTVLRGGKPQEVTVTVRNLEEANRGLVTAVKERLGVEVRPVTSRESEQYGLESSQGVAITWVDPRSALGKAGLEVRDILMALDDQPVESVDHLAALITAAQPRQHFMVQVLDHRSGDTGAIEVVVR